MTRPVRHRLVALLAATLCLSACPRPHLSDRCSAGTVRVQWAATPAPGRIEGTVIDRGADAPVGNLALYLDGSDRVARTGGDGRFHFDSVSTGRHVLVNATSVYQPHADTVDLPAGAGLRGTITLNTRRDVLTHCEIYRP